MRQEGVPEPIAIDTVYQGVRITLPDSLLFPSGFADFLATSGIVVERISRLIRGTTYPVRIESYTDSTPTSNPQYPSNWDLSRARAEALMQALVTHHGQDPKRLMAAGCADMRPLDSNGTREGRLKNRRIEVTVLNPERVFRPLVVPAWPSTGDEEWWKLTFADMTNLLLVFFVFLFAVRALDLAAFKKAVASIGAPKPDVFVNVPVAPVEKKVEIKQEVIPTAPVRETGFSGAEAKSFLARKGIADRVRLTSEKRGTVITMSDHVIFSSGSAELGPQSNEVLDVIGDILRDNDYLVRIEGHTDNTPIATAQHPSNWHLSADRAAIVVRYLTERYRLDPTRFSVAGYGEFRPISHNDTLEGKAKNRRVEIVILNKRQSELEGKEAEFVKPKGASSEGVSKSPNEAPKKMMPNIPERIFGPSVPMPPVPFEPQG